MTNLQKLRKAQLSLAKQMRKKGASNAEIAKKTGLSIATVRAHLGCQPKAITSRVISNSWTKRRQNALKKSQHLFVNAIYNTLLHQTGPAVERIESGMDDESAAIARLEARLAAHALTVIKGNKPDDKAA